MTREMGSGKGHLANPTPCNLAVDNVGIERFYGEDG